ncbi:putative porin [Maribellus sp. YY47]|uniref:putative porin n=1 Tax=Maribellus sp. YY47 TaxID=2929486 RepID=UPI002001735B|nr:putative porin [Maribellus sp. YY47]MCK3686284.1 putative porin [Maribellus sp. YY47]
MQRILTVLFIISGFLFTALNAYPQRDLDLQSNRGEVEANAGKPDTIKPEIGLWYLSGYGAFIDSTQLDTLQDYIHIFHPVYKNNVITASYVGNYGTPALDNNFFNRKYNTNFFFARTRDAYILSPAKLKYINTHTPYTRLDYTQSENKSKNNETRFNVIHSQNIKPWWNFTFRVDLAKSDGQYIAQEAKNNSVTLYTSYTKDNLFIHGGFITNSLNNNENGGLISDSLLLDEQGAEYWNVNLNSTQSHFASSYFFADGEYRFGKFIETGEDGEEQFRPIFGMLYNVELNFNRQDFTDKEDDKNKFFPTTYYPESYTTDSIRYNRVSNIFQLKQYENTNKKYSFGKRAFLGVELNRGSMPGEYDYVSKSSQFPYPEHLLGVQVADSMVYKTDIKYSNTFVGGGIFRETGKFWKWNAEGKIYLTGRNAGQTELRGIIYKPMHFLGDSLASISFSGAIENLKPDYFQEKFYSNHFRWDQNLKTEQRLTAGGTFKMPRRKLELGAKYAVINNYIFNDTLGIPDQTSNEILVLSAYVDKDFNFRKLHFRTRVLWQKVSEERYIHLPDWSAFISAYYQFTISKVMFTQIGTDVRYNTKYYADAYAPSTGLFYLQNEKQYGDYPYIDVYASLRLKRTRVFFKWMNIGTRFLDGEYMTVPHYPMNQSTFRLGVSWAFYD